jgi:predicted nucleic acid-binding protein
MKFWDSSALIPLFVDEAHSDCVKPIFEGDKSVAAWWATPVECCSSFARLVRENRISITEDEEIRKELDIMANCWGEIDPTQESRTIARRLLMRHPLRAADSMQLAAALVWADNQPEGFEFVCLDKRLRDAARSEGFAVLPHQRVFEAISPDV